MKSASQHQPQQIAPGKAKLITLPRATGSHTDYTYVEVIDTEHRIAELVEDDNHAKHSGMVKGIDKEVSR